MIQETTGQRRGEGVLQEELNAEMEPLFQEVPGLRRIVGWGSVSTSLPYSYTFCFQFRLLQPYCGVPFGESDWRKIDHGLVEKPDPHHAEKWLQVGLSR